MNKYNKQKHTVKPRSVEFKPEEHEAFKTWVNGFDNISAAARSLQVTRQTIYSLLTKGTGSHDVIVKARKRLGKASK